MPPEELERVERFLAAFNAIEGHLQVLFAQSAPAPRRDGRAGRAGGPMHEGESVLPEPSESRQSFRSLLDWFAKRNAWWPHAEAMRAFIHLRNLLVHEKIAPWEYPCVPSEDSASRIESIRDGLLFPERALPRWKKGVVSLGQDDKLRHALRVMDESGFGVFPVYEGKHFRGVLSENSLARWLAGASTQADKSGSLNLDSVRVGDVLQSAQAHSRRSERERFAWADARTSTAEIAHLFHANTFLEAVLISAHGRDEEELEGIVTRADVLSWEGDAREF
jgi:CBS domain-containing protein